MNASATPDTGFASRVYPVVVNSQFGVDDVLNTSCTTSFDRQ